ncbi:hypothetical protein U1Q18_024998, partial [Sarracenia purpurea var. burkii]
VQFVLCFFAVAAVWFEVQQFGRAVWLVLLQFGWCSSFVSCFVGFSWCSSFELVQQFGIQLVQRFQFSYGSCLAEASVAFQQQLLSSSLGALAVWAIAAVCSGLGVLAAVCLVLLKLFWALAGFVLVLVLLYAFWCFCWARQLAWFSSRIFFGRVAIFSGFVLAALAQA